MEKQNILEYLKDQMQQGKMTADEANVQKVRMERFLIVRNKLPAQLRKSLMKAVKDGQLGRRMKTENKPEYFYHPNWEHLAKQQIYSDECKMIQALKGVCR